MIITISDPYRAKSLVYSKSSAIEMATSSNGMAHTRKGVQELGRGWLFIWSMKFLKSRNLLMPA